jgi:hypothetical protein
MDSTVEPRVSSSTNLLAGISDKLANLLAHIWDKLELPVTEIFVHSIVTVLSILSISGIEQLLHWVGLDGKDIPFTNVTLSTWMFCLEILASTLIILIGIWKAARALWRS